MYSCVEKFRIFAVQLQNFVKKVMISKTTWSIWVWQKACLQNNGIHLIYIIFMCVYIILDTKSKRQESHTMQFPQENLYPFSASIKTHQTNIKNQFLPFPWLKCISYTKQEKMNGEKMNFVCRDLINMKDIMLFTTWHKHDLNTKLPQKLVVSFRHRLLRPKYKI